MRAFFHALYELPHRLGWAGTVALSIGLAVGSLAIGALVIVRWPADHFKEGRRAVFWSDRHPVVRALGLAGKNLAGILLTLLGVVMTLPGVPGQGLLLILVGLTLIDFPGKLALERRLVRRQAVLKVVNAVRARFGHPPLELD